MDWFWRCDLRKGLHMRNAHLYMAEFGGPAVTLRGPEAAKIQLLTNPLTTNRVWETLTLGHIPSYCQTAYV